MKHVQPELKRPSKKEREASMKLLHALFEKREAEAKRLTEENRPFATQLVELVRFYYDYRDGSDYMTFADFVNWLENMYGRR